MSSTSTAHAGAKGDFSSLEPLLNPRSVAVVGASADASRIGGRPVAYMLKQGYQGVLMPVNPARDKVQGLQAYADIDALPVAPDTAIVAVPAAQVVDTIESLGRKGGKSAIVFSSGFSEVGSEGEAHQRALSDTARRWGVRLLGPNTAGAFNSTLGFYGSFASGLERGFPLPGRIGIASQSGAYMAHLMGLARARGMGTPIGVSTGNESDISLGEVIGWMAHSPDIDVIMAYAETVRDVRSFISALEAAHAARKPVILQKVGKSSLGMQAALSHTASLVGDDKVFEAVLADYAVIRVDSSAELLNIAYAASRQIYPVNNTLGMITISGGAGIIVSDVAEEQGVSMPPMPKAAQLLLKEKISFCSPTNPVDCTAHVLNDLSLVEDFAASMVLDGHYQSVLAFFSQAGSAPTVAPRLRQALTNVKNSYPDRLFVMSLIGDEEQRRPWEEAGFVMMEDPVEATRVIAAMGQLGEAFARPLPEPPSLKHIELPQLAVGEAEAKQLLANHRIPSAPEGVAIDAASAVSLAESFGYPVVLKIASPDIIHKSDIGGVLLDVNCAEEVHAGVEIILRNTYQHMPEARVDGVLVARQLTGGVECFMGIQRDLQFGPVAVFGLGGVFVEVLQDVVFRRCPFGVEQARSMILSIKGAPLLCGARGRPETDVEALAEILSALSHFAYQAGDRLESIDLNPVLAMPKGQGAFAVDAVIQLQKEGDHAA